MNWRRIWSIARKEIYHIGRDKFTLILALVLPVIVVLIFGFAIDFDLKKIPTAYLDSDKTLSSRQLMESFGSSNYFVLHPVFSSAEGLRLIESERVRSLIIIPPEFEKDLLSGRGAGVQILVDAADNASASSIMSYVGEIRTRAMERIIGSENLIPTQKAPLQIKPRYLFNPELNSQWFIVPGLIVVIMAVLSILLTALTVAKEWERGSMELLLSTPVRPLEIIVGKLLPYAFLGIGGMAIVYLLARIVFHVPFRGSHFVLLLGCLLFLGTYLAQGLLISVLTRKQMIAMQFAMLSGLLPSILLSGFIFPIESMPAFFRYFTMVLPARWFMVIVRDSFLQGSSLWDLRTPLISLTLIGLFFITVATKRFKRNVEP